jgi:hypothetical protein
MKLSYQAFYAVASSSGHIADHDAGKWVPNSECGSSASENATSPESSTLGLQHLLIRSLDFPIVAMMILRNLVLFPAVYTLRT